MQAVGRVVAIGLGTTFAVVQACVQSCPCNAAFLIGIEVV